MWVIPATIAVFIQSFQSIASLGVIAAYWLVFINTGIVQIRSRRMIWYKSEYEGLHSSEGVAYGIIALGVILMLGQIYTMLS